MDSKRWLLLIRYCKNTAQKPGLSPVIVADPMDHFLSLLSGGSVALGADLSTDLPLIDLPPLLLPLPPIPLPPAPFTENSHMASD